MGKKNDRIKQLEQQYVEMTVGFTQMMELLFAEMLQHENHHDFEGALGTAELSRHLLEFTDQMTAEEWSPTTVTRKLAEVTGHAITPYSDTEHTEMGMMAIPLKPGQSISEAIDEMLGSDNLDSMARAILEGLRSTGTVDQLDAAHRDHIRKSHPDINLN